MRTAVCGGSPAETDSLCRRLAGLRASQSLGLEPLPVPDMDAFLMDYRPGAYHAVYVALGGPAGFLAARRLREDAKALEAAGAFAIVLEGIPAPLAKEITAELTIPTIGIGAGVHCDGQVLVISDILGLGGAYNPKFAKRLLKAS